jgi:hypothetical protein
MSTTDRKALMHPGTITMLYVGDLHPTGCDDCDCQHYRYKTGGGVMQGDPPAKCQCGDYVFRHRWRPFDPADPICQTAAPS